MSSKLRLVLSAVLLALLIAAAAFAYDRLSAQIKPEIGLSEVQSAAEESSGQTQLDKIEAPDFTVYRADGSAVKLSDMRGAPVVLNFWASWCPPCKEEMPDFEEVFLEPGGRAVFMMVCMTDGARETAETGSEYIAQQGFTFPVYYDTDEQAALVYGIRALPTTIFIDADGYIVAGREGMLDIELLRRGLELISGAD